MPPRSSFDPIPALVPGQKGPAVAFHAWCQDELRRRRGRDADLDPARFGRAARLVLEKLSAELEDDE